MKHRRARAEAKLLVQRLRRSNREAERSGAAKLPRRSTSGLRRS
jgi:hypothetical protein